MSNLFKAPEKIRIAVLASGRGSNALSIIRKSFDLFSNYTVEYIIADRDSPVLEMASSINIKTKLFEYKKYQSREIFCQSLIEFIDKENIKLVAMAGFMTILSENFTNFFRNRILNIHPSLLPAFPGLHPERKSLDCNVSFSGCTVHYVNEKVDDGKIIMQDIVSISLEDSPESLREKILEKELVMYPNVISEIAGNISGTRPALLLLKCLETKRIDIKLAQAKETIKTFFERINYIPWDFDEDKDLILDATIKVLMNNCEEKAGLLSPVCSSSPLFENEFSSLRLSNL